MPCAEFEAKLIDHANLPDADRRLVSEHVAACAGCREYLAALESMDRQLEAHFSGITAPDRLRTSVFASAEAPSRIPELLDGAGWIAILGIAVAIGWYERLMVDVATLAWIGASASVVAVLWLSLRWLSSSESLK